MASSSNNQITAVTGKMQSAQIRDIGARNFRKAVGSKLAITKAKNEWNTTLIGKVFDKDAVKTNTVRKGVIILWNRFRVRCTCFGYKLISVQVFH